MTLASQAEALFVSSIQPSDRPTLQQIGAAIRHSQQSHGGEPGCTGEFACEYGEHPEASADRMRWALALVAGRYTAAAA